MLSRHMLIEMESECPVEMQEAVYSLCWAAARAEVPELMGVKQQLMLKFPAAFDIDPRTGRPLVKAPGAESVQDKAEAFVNARLRGYFGISVPERDLVVKYLTEIAGVFAPDWEPPAWLVDTPPEQAHMINVDAYVRPGEFEPGHSQPPSAPPGGHPGPCSRTIRNTNGYSSTDLAMGFANVRAGTQKRRAMFRYPPEH